MNVNDALSFMQTPPVHALWDQIQSALPTITASCVLAILFLNIRLRDSVRDLTKEVHDKNGLRASRDNHELRIKELEVWKIREDTIDATEKELMKDVGRDPETVSYTHLTLPTSD